MRSLPVDLLPSSVIVDVTVGQDYATYVRYTDGEVVVTGRDQQDEAEWVSAILAKRDDVVHAESSVVA